MYFLFPSHFCSYIEILWLDRYKKGWQGNKKKFISNWKVSWDFHSWRFTNNPHTLPLPSKTKILGLLEIRILHLRKRREISFPTVKMFLVQWRIQGGAMGPWLPLGPPNWNKSTENAHMAYTYWSSLSYWIYLRNY